MENASCTELEHYQLMAGLCGYNLHKWLQQQGSPFAAWMLLHHLVQTGRCVDEKHEDAGPLDNITITITRHFAGAQGSQRCRVSTVLPSGETIAHGDSRTEYQEANGMISFHSALANLAADLMERGLIKS